MTKLHIDDWGKWIDFTAGGIFAAMFGPHWQPPRSKMTCCYSAHYTNATTERYIAMLKEFTGYESVALFSTGAEATEAFWRICRVATGKPGIWGGLINPDEVGETDPYPLPDCMHGVTLGALIMAGKMRLPHPGMFIQLGAELEGKTYDATGCAILEPYHAPSAQFHRENPTMDRIRTNIKTHEEIHFCCDEVQGGFGRTGRLFAHQWYQPEIKPEFVTIGKLCGGGLPLSAVLGPKDIMEDALTLENAHLHSTHSGNPLMCAAGIKVIKRVQKENLIARSFELGLMLDSGLASIKQRHHSGRGLLAGIEFEGPLMASKVVKACQRRGLLVCDTGRKWVKIGPALTITPEEIEQGCEILKSAIEEVENEIAACGDSSETPGESNRDIQESGVSDVGPSGDTLLPKDERP